MDAFRPADLNPLSDAFRQEALRNVQQNISAMRSQKELRAKEDGTSPDDVHDQITLQSSAPSKTLGSAKDPTDVREAAETALEGAARDGLLEEKDPRVQSRRREDAKRMARDGVPAEILQASQQIVEGQLDPVKGPRGALKGLKTSPETAQMQMAPADFHPVMEIHDQGNAPIPLEDGPGGA